MALLTPQEHRDNADKTNEGLVYETIALCNARIGEAVRMETTEVRVFTDIGYGEWNIKNEVEAQLEAAGYRIDSEMSVRHGLIIDIMWD